MSVQQPLTKIEIWNKQQEIMITTVRKDTARGIVIQETHSVTDKQFAKLLPQLMEELEIHT